MGFGKKRKFCSPGKDLSWPSSTISKAGEVARRNSSRAEVASGNAFNGATRRYGSGWLEAR